MTRNYSLNLAYKINASINVFCAPILALNLLLQFILSISWLVCIFRQLMKQNRKFKSRNIGNERKQKEILNNYNSYRIRDVFLIIICLCESAFVPILAIYQFIFYLELHYRNNLNFSAIFKYRQDRDHVHDFDKGFYLSLFHFDLRLFRALIVITMYPLLIFVRILTQFLVHKYSFYKYNLKLKTRLGISLCFLLVLFISGLIRIFMIPFYFIIAFAFTFEYLVLFKVTRRLRRLLKQRLTDALYHESVDICLYYKTVYGNYKYFSIVLLLALFFQCASYIILCIHFVVVTILAFPNNWFSEILHEPDTHHIYQQFDSHPNVIIYNLIVCSIHEVILTIGLCIQNLPYMFVSFLNLFRSIKKRIRGSSINTMLMQRLIEKHNNAYEGNHLIL